MRRSKTSRFSKTNGGSSRFNLIGKMQNKAND